MMEYKEKFIPIEYVCACGKETVCSHYSGHYSQCSCGGCAVDQTEHYVRFIGAKLKRKDDNSSS